MGLLNTKYGDVDKSVLIGRSLDKYYIDTIKNGTIYIEPKQEAAITLTCDDIKQLREYGLRDIFMSTFRIEPGIDNKTMLNFDKIKIKCIDARINDRYLYKNLDLTCVNLEINGYKNLINPKNNLKINTVYTIHLEDEAPQFKELINIQECMFHTFEYHPVDGRPDLRQCENYNINLHKYKDVQNFLISKGYQNQNVIFVSSYDVYSSYVYIYKNFIIENPTLAEKCGMFDAMKYSVKDVIYRDEKIFYTEVETRQIPNFHRFFV